MRLVQQLNRVTLGFLKCSWRLCLVQHRCFRSVRWWMGFYVLSEGAWKSFENFCDFIYEVFNRKSFSTSWCCARTCAGTDQFTWGNLGPPLTATTWQRSTTSAWSSPCWKMILVTETEVPSYTGALKGNLRYGLDLPVPGLAASHAIWGRAPGRQRTFWGWRTRCGVPVPLGLRCCCCIYSPW